MLATKAPMVMPGQQDLPNNIMSAKAIPDGGHAGNAVVFSNAKK